jgi:hypothetical protein
MPWKAMENLPALAVYQKDLWQLEVEASSIDLDYGRVQHTGSRIDKWRDGLIALFQASEDFQMRKLYRRILKDKREASLFLDGCFYKNKPT